MSDSRVNKQKLVNFHPTGSGVISCLNGSVWDGSTRKRPLSYFPLSRETNAAFASTVTLIDYSGNGNNGTFYYATGTNNENSSWSHSDTPWGPSLRNGIHKHSVVLGSLSGSKSEAGWSASWDYGSTMPFLLHPKASINLTGSDGTISTNIEDGPIFGESYTTMAWFKPSEGVFTTVAGEKVGIGLFNFHGMDTLFYRVEDGKLAFHIDATAGSTYDYQVRTKKRNLFKPGRWYHIAISRNVDGRQIPRIYLNGKRLEVEFNVEWAGSNSGAGIPATSLGAYGFKLGTFNSLNSVTVNPGNNSSSNKVDRKNFVGRVTQWITWASQLSDRDVYTIYGAALSAAERKSGNIDVIPQRERLYIRDNKTGSYPTVQRSGIDNRQGSYRASYDDRNTIIFNKHEDVFPGEIDKIGKGFDRNDIMGWWRLQGLYAEVGDAIQTRWLGRTKINGAMFNDVSDRMMGNGTFISGITGAPGAALGSAAQVLIDSGPNSLTGTWTGDATMTTDQRSFMTFRSNKTDMNALTGTEGPFPKPSADDLKLMSPDQLSRWGGRKGVFLPQSGSHASYIRFVDSKIDTPTRLVKNLRGGVCRDIPWTISMWVNLKQKASGTIGSHGRTRYDFHGLFRIENNSGSISRARLLQDRNTGKWSIKWWAYGIDDSTNSVSTASIYTNKYYENGLTYSGSSGTGSMPNHGLPDGWNHLSFVYRGGPAKSSNNHWQGQIRGVRLFGINTGLRGTRQYGGRMQIYLNGKRLIASASLTNVDSFKRLVEPHQSIHFGKKIVFGHYKNPGQRRGTNTSFTTTAQSLTGAFSGSMAEIALISKALKPRSINRIIRNGINSPSINVTDFPLMLNRDSRHMSRQAVSDIKTFGSSMPGIADARVSFTKGDSLEPFNDRKTLIATGSNLVGTPASVYPNLEAPLHSKASFSINITPKHDMHLLKWMHTGPAYLTGTSSWNSDQAASWNVGRSTLRAVARNQSIATNEYHGEVTGSAGTAYPRVDGSYIGSALPGFLKSGGTIPIGDYTGFVYYNFKDGKWDQIGTYDPSSGKRIHYDYAHLGYYGQSNSIALAQTLLMSASYPQQFKPKSKYRYDTSDSMQFDAMTGRPHINAAAPYANKYHATASNVLSLSNYITEPFLLERVRVELPVEAHHSFGGDDLHAFTNKMHASETSTTAHAPEGAKFNLAGRIRSRQTNPEESLVFFLYRQTRPPAPKLRPPRHASDLHFTGSSYSNNSIEDYTHPQIVSGSQRFLICSGVATFYNDSTFAIGSVAGNEGNPTQNYNSTAITSSNFPNSYEPAHKPAWQHNWAIQMTSTSAEYATQTTNGTAHGHYTGSIILDIKPAIQSQTTLGHYEIFGGNRNFAGGYHYDATTSAGSRGGPGAKQHVSASSPGLDRGLAYAYWPGGTAWRNIYNRRVTGKTDDLGLAGQGQYKVLQNYGADFIENIVLNTGNQYILDNPVDIDPRVALAGTDRNTTYGATGNPQHLIQGKSDGSQKQYPYLLLPEDELVFGIDFLPSIVIEGQQANELSGSYVKLLSSGSGASVTFYGSFLKEDRPRTPSLNQNLTSNAVHEIIGAEPIVDQQMIYSRTQYSGSYIDNLFRGGPPGRSGMIEGYNNGKNGLIRSGNMQFGRRWRQSIVGSDRLKVFSRWSLIHRSGTLNSVDGLTGRGIYKFLNTPHGGPAWGSKHSTGPLGDAHRLRYEEAYISGFTTGSGETTAPETFYYSNAGPAVNFPGGVFPGDDTLLATNSAFLRKPMRASLLRGVRLVSENERYYDSLIPHIGQYAKSHKGHVIMGRSHVDNKTRRPAFSLPGQTSIVRSGTFYDDGIGALYPNSTTVRNFTGARSYIAGAAADYPTINRAGTSKGIFFRMEPCDRGSWPVKNALEAGSDDVRAAAYYTRTTWGSSTQKVPSHTHYDGSATKSLGATESSEINKGNFSGSLSFPFEMSPRRIAKNQRFMMTVFTGTLTHNSGGSHTGPVNANMYVWRPKQIRQMLFRLGVDDDDAIMSILSSNRDRTRIRANYSTPAVTDTRNLQPVWAEYGGGLRALGAGFINTTGPGHTTGTFVKFRGNTARHPGAQGFRYGLINTEPMQTTAVFRHDRYGQYRDMLEQRHFTRFYKKIPTVLQARRLFRRLARLRTNVVTTGPVSIKFRSTLTNRLINPNRTYSQNLSPVATSSLPYFDADRDGKFRNRPFPFDESILDSHIVVEEDI
ncbi:LamG domain-containing protein [bacterium]|nr:LamG domain-containing protein [bacterium]